jgi:flagellar assembly protein FliH
MVRIIKSQTAAAAGQVVLQLHDFAEQARGIVLQARQESARIVTQARRQGQEILEQARQTAYAEGFARGQNDGLASVQQAPSGDTRVPGELAGLVHSVLAELTSVQNRRDAEAAELLELALEIARKIIGQVAVSDIGAARANLAKVLELAAASREMIVRVNPDQLQQLQAHCRELVDELAVRGKVELVGDEQIAPGGVKLQTRHGELDATIGRQLDNVVDALLGDAAAGPLFGVYRSPREADDSAGVAWPSGAARA